MSATGIALATADVRNRSEAAFPDAATAKFS